MNLGFVCTCTIGNVVMVHVLWGIWGEDSPLCHEMEGLVELTV